MAAFATRAQRKRNNKAVEAVNTAAEVKSTAMVLNSIVAKEAATRRLRRADYGGRRKMKTRVHDNSL
jgi:hypothetical protein